MVKYNAGTGFAGGVSGAASGFASGGMPGGIFGALMGLLGGFGGTSKDKNKQLPTMNPDQLRLLKQINQMLGPQGQLGEGYGQSLDTLKDWMDPNGEAYQRFADPYMKEFEQQTVPGLAERFAGMGGGMGGGLSSSGFGQALGAAGGNLQSQLAQLKAQLAGSAASQMMGQYGQMAGQSLGARPFGYQHTQGGPGVGTQAFAGYANAGFPGAGQAGQGIWNAWQNNQSVPLPNGGW